MKTDPLLPLKLLVSTSENTKGLSERELSWVAFINVRLLTSSGSEQSMKCGSITSTCLENLRVFLFLAESQRIVETCVVLLGNLKGPVSRTPTSTSTPLVTAPDGTSTEMLCSLRQKWLPELVNSRREVGPTNGKRLCEVSRRNSGTGDGLSEGCPGCRVMSLSMSSESSVPVCDKDGVLRLRCGLP